MTTTLHQKVGILLFGIMAAGCATTPESEYQIPHNQAADRLRQMESWIAGDFEASELAEANAEEIEADQTDRRARQVIRDVTAAEMLFWSGDIERAYDLYARALRTDAAHPMARFAAARIYQLRNRVVNYRQRTADLLESLDYDGIGALTRVDLSLAAQTVAHRRWEQSDAAEPFAADQLGFPARWRVTPALSKWPILDIDREFPPQTQPSLAETYLSPWYAEPVAKNRKPTRPYNSDGLNLSPSLRSDGIYVLETYVNVEPLTDTSAESGSPLGGRIYWLYGSFAGGATVWIDGKKVLQRRMEDYDTSKRLRRIRLEPGSHRVLVKLGYENNYRDWFDLAFLGDAAKPLSGSGLTFSRTPESEPNDSDGQDGGIELISQQHRPSVLERLRVPGAGVTKRTHAVTLYWTAVAGALEHQPEVFEPAFDELMRRYPEFAAGHALKAQQLRTLWELPYDTRRSRARSRVQRAHEANPESVYYLMKVVEILRDQGASNDRIRRHLRLARQAAFTGDGAAIREDSPDDGETILLPPDRRGRLKTIEPLVEWASWLTSKGWNPQAEDAWRAVLSLEPGSCHAAGELQSLWYARSYFPGLDELTPKHASCNRLRWRKSHHQPESEVADYRLDYLKRKAERFPLNAGHQISLADAYLERGQSRRARKVLEQAKARMPRNGRIWSELAAYAFVDSDEQASDVLLRGLRAAGSSPSLLKSLSWLEEATPLTNYLRDGREVVRDHLRTEEKMRGPGGDDSAYFVLDFALRKYLPDGASLTLTHTITRVMTKGAIDRFGEQPIPANQYLLRARIINPDGTVDIPDRTAGKSTLSMPGLDEGDFVELAWVSYSGPSYVSRSHLSGMRFFFRMPDISSMHSEYVLLGPNDMKFVRRHEPPQAERVSPGTGAPSVFPSEYGWQSGVRFLEEGSSRPRSEPYSVDGGEFLPWIKMYRRGVTISPFEIRRRQTHDQLARVLKVSDPLQEQVRKWRAGTEPGSIDEVKQLFYRVTEHVTQGDYLDFYRDASHVAVTGEGSRLVLLKAAYDVVGIESDIYMVKSTYETPTVLPIGEAQRYGRGVLRVQTEAGVHWVAPNQRDAMFGAVPVGSMGQPAVCVTCDADERTRTSLPTDGYRPNTREIEITGSLNKEGTLTGTAAMTFHGVRAATVRNSLRERPDESSRRSFFDSVMSSVISGASLQSYDILGIDEDDEPLTIEIEFERTGFARPVSGDSESSRMRIQTSVFGTPLASRYAALAERQRPLMIGRQRNDRQTLTVELPDGMTADITSQSGEWSYDSSFGTFERHTAATDGQLRIENRLKLPIQRISTKRYGEFQSWAVKVERSARVEAVVQAN